MKLIDNLEIAAKVSIGIFRQKRNGPVRALHLSKPLEGVFEFLAQLNNLETPSNSLRFTRTCSTCTLCSTEQSQHEVSDYRS
jgi:hypothetical protein